MTELLETPGDSAPGKRCCCSRRGGGRQLDRAPIARVAVAGATDTDATGIGAGALTVIADCCCLAFACRSYLC